VVGGVAALPAWRRGARRGSDRGDASDRVALMPVARLGGGRRLEDSGGGARLGCL
jgi:hypothetical protein